MKSATHHRDLLPPVIRPTSLQTTKFKDGMVITADDLDTAMRYPLAVFQSLIRAYFGCGVVCGLKLELKQASDPKDGNKKKPVAICVSRGTALGCDGFPIELCAPVTLPLKSDPCCDHPLKCVCIAIRRITSDEAPRDDCGCSKDTDAQRYQCTRVKDHVEIRAFACDDLEGICARPKPSSANREGEGSAAQEYGVVEGEATYEPFVPDCECLTTCEECDCCGPSWVLLGCVDLEAEVPAVDYRRRKFVKPIECLCRPKPKRETKPDDSPTAQEPGRYPAGRKKSARK